MTKPQNSGPHSGTGSRKHDWYVGLLAVARSDFHSARAFDSAPVPCGLSMARPCETLRTRENISNLSTQAPAVIPRSPAGLDDEESLYLLGI